MCKLKNCQTILNSATKYSPKEFTWDHIYPKSLGGTSDLSNLQASHKLCNNIKGSTPPAYEQSAHYQINIVVNMSFDDCANLVMRNKNRNTRKTNPMLRKQDSWCHKHKKIRHNKYHGR